MTEVKQARLLRRHEKSLSLVSRLALFGFGLSELGVNMERLYLLRQILTERFDESELRDLCLALNVDYESLPGGGKLDKARELVAFLDRRDRIYDFLETGRQLRSDIPWTKIYLDDQMDQLRTRRDQADQARLAVREGLRLVNLRPMDVTHAFKDRLREIAALCHHLTDSTVRLIIVVGRAGMGKTSLASYVLADLERGRLPVSGGAEELDIKGILYLSARSTGLGLERIYTDIGCMLGEPAASRLATFWADSNVPLAAKIEYLLGEMRDDLYLILLDNLEDELYPDGAIREEGLRIFVERCLIQPSGARLIVTSREQIKITAAALRNVRNVTLKVGLPDYEAMALLRDLDPQGELGLRDAPDDELRRAAQLTRGIPRALEILAGILQDPTISLSRLLTDDRLFGEQVVEQLVAEGYRRLGDNERRIMEALAVFDCPVEETAVIFLLHPWFPNVGIRASLRRLVNSYFVSANRVTGEYSLHPLDHDYAYHQIPDRAEMEGGYTRRNLELRAADFFVSIRKPPSRWRSIDDLAPQLAEFGHRVRAGDYDNAGMLLQTIDSSHLHLWGHFTLLVELRENLLGRLTSPDLQAINLGDLGSSYRALGQVDRAISFDMQALSITRQVGDRVGEQHHLYGLGSAYRSLGQMEQAIEYFDEALAIARELGDRAMEGFCLGELGTAYSHLGQLERAIKLYEQALTIAQEVGERRHEADWLGHLGRVYCVLGEYPKAIEFCEKALMMSREVGGRWSEIVRLGNLGNIYLALRQVKRAIHFYEEALTIAREIRYRRGESFQLLGLGQALLVDGQFAQAQQRCNEALALDVPKVSNQVATVLGIVLLNKRDPAARTTFADAVARSQAILTKSAGLYEAHYALATALAGEAVCDPRWADAQVSERAQLLAPALSQYRRALEICAAPGAIHDALHNLEMIRAADIRGLEPVFELLAG